MHFFVCTNERAPGSSLPCCADRGGHRLLEAFQAEQARCGWPRGLKVSGSTCLTTCNYGPTVVVYPEGVWYAGVAAADIGELFDAHLNGRGSVRRLLLPPDVPVW